LFLAELAQRSNRTYLVARHQGEVVGYAGMMFMGREAHVTNIAVEPDFHGRKVGTRLLLALANEAIAKGADSISLEVRVSNKVAQSMYEKFGFSAVGVRRGYYIETNEDALVMVVREARSTGYRLRLQAIREELDGAAARNPDE
jgi:ribosomal-protein-alanine N-acetyltransferase